MWESATLSGTAALRYILYIYVCTQVQQTKKIVFVKWPSRGTSQHLVISELIVLRPRHHEPLIMAIVLRSSEYWKSYALFEFCVWAAWLWSKTLPWTKKHYAQPPRLKVPLGWRKMALFALFVLSVCPETIILAWVGPHRRVGPLRVLKVCNSIERTCLYKYHLGVISCFKTKKWG